MIKREIVETLGILAIFTFLEIIIKYDTISKNNVIILILFLALSKSIYFIFESLWNLHAAALTNQTLHSFLMVVAYNMFEATVSFGLDFDVLETVQPNSLSGIDPNLGSYEVFFDCIFFSLLNFSFFGFGEIMPETVPSKMLVMLEVFLAFMTVIFILSDFASLKQSIRGQSSQDEPSGSQNNRLGSTDNQQ